MKKAWKIIRRVALGLLVAVYVAVAAVNYSVVQSYAGRLAGNYFSREWGGTVRIGSLHAMPWDHLIVDELLLVAPDGDTILDAESLRVRFRRFPFHNNGLDLQQVTLKNAYYHLASSKEEGAEKATINLHHIIDYYKARRKPKEKKAERKPFTVQVETLVLNSVHYKMDLPDKRKVVYEQGVQIPHMEFYDIRGRFKGLRVVNDDVTVRIAKLRTEERSGFRVDNISGRVHVSSYEITAHDMVVATPKSHIACDAELTYGHWNEMKDYLRTVMHRATIKEGTTVAMSDVAYWAPVLWGIDLQLRAEGEAEGTINDLRTDGLEVDYGLATHAEVVGGIAGLPGIDTTTIDIRHAALRTEESDLRHIAAVMGDRLPQQVRAWIGRVGYVDATASGHGGIGSATRANVDLACGLGNLKADVRTEPLPHGRRHIGIDAESDGVSLAWLGSDWLTHTGAALSVDATMGKPGDLRAWTATADGTLTGSVVRHNQMGPVSAHAELNNGEARITVSSADTLAHLDLEAVAVLADSLREYSVRLDLKHLDGEAFGLLPHNIGSADAYLNAYIAGNTPDDMSGSVWFERLNLGESNIGPVNLSIRANDGDKRLTLWSTVLTATATAHMTYRDMPLMVRHFIAEAIPAELGNTARLDSAELASIAGNTLEINATWTDNGPLTHAIKENLTIAQGTRLGASYNSTEQLKIALRSDSVRIGSLAMTGIGVSSRSTPEGFTVGIESQEARLGTIELMRDAEMTLLSNRSRAVAKMTWGDNEATTQGDLMLRLQDGMVDILHHDFAIGGNHWSLAADSIRLSPTLGLDARGIVLASERQHIGADLRLMGKENDCVELDFNSFDIATVATLLLQGTAFSVGGEIDGRFSMYGLTSTPYFNVGLTIDSCVVNRQPLGDVKVRSNWNAELGTLSLTLGSDQIDAHGWMELGKKDADLNFAVDFDSFELALIAPFMSSFSSRFEGQLHGSFDIAGTLSDPVILGEAMVENGALKVDLTNVTYYFADSIRFDNRIITLDNFKVRDPRGNTAYVDGTIAYRGTSDMTLDLHLATDNLLVLDQRRGEQFYGTLLASAQGDIGGRIDDLSINVRARTNPGCTLTVPVSERKQMKSQNYITFVSDSPVATTTTDKKSKRQGHYGLELDLGITPDVQLNLPMDFSEVGVTVGATGSGDLHLSLDEQNTPQVLGSYEIINGTMKLSLLSLIDKNFSIESGSSLNFQGSLPSARFDMKAVYSQRVNLSSLTGSLSAIDNTQKYIQVEDVIAVSGTLQDPTIGFDLRLPNADQSVEDEVFAYIDRNSERDMLNQTLSLLVSGQFYNVNGNATASNATGSGLGTIASTLAGALTDMVDIVDINVDYKSATELTNEQIDVNISRDWGRWYLESTLGYGGDSREIESSAVGGTVLDALVGYRISPLVHVFAYNRTNNNDYTRMDLPYKQGVGLKLTKDFDRWGDIFRRTKKRTDKQEKK